MIISHNLSAMNASGKLNITKNNLSRNTEKLSSGYRINRSADDAAGLTISEKMRSQIRGLNRASTNAQDGISYIQTAEGALQEIHSVLQRGRELSVQAANDTNTSTDRAAIQQELDALTKEIDRISKDTMFNTMNVFDSANVTSSSLVTPNTGTASTIVLNSLSAGDEGSGSAKTVTLDAGYMTCDMQNFSSAISQASALGMTFTQSAIADFANQLKDVYVPTLLGDITSSLSSATPTIASGLSIGLEMYCTNNNVLAYVSSNGQSYSLGVNLYYLSETNGSIAMNDDLATTIAHEMTHAVMFDTVSNGMFGINGADSFPSWFVEGTAQAVGGAINYCQELTYRYMGSDSDISTWLSRLTDTSNAYNSYAQGYIASMYLGYVAGGEGSVTSATIANGINNILSDISNGYSLSESIYKRSNGKYSTLSDFENKFSTDAVTFTKNLVAAIGNGAGSIVAPGGLSASKSSLLTGSTTSNFFTLDVDTTSASNTMTTNPYTGGGATTSNGSRRDGSTNPDASTAWTGPTSSGSTGGTSGTGGSGGSGGTGGSGGSGSSGGTGGSGGSGGSGVTRRSSGTPLHLQVGALAYQGIDLETFRLSVKDLGLEGLNATSFEKAGDAIQRFDSAIDQVSDMRSYYGAMQNRLEHTISNLDNTSENTQSAESRIRDTDMAEEMLEYSKNNILQQAGQTILAQANQSTQGVLQLLQ